MSGSSRSIPCFEDSVLLVLLAGQVSAANVIHCSMGITFTVPFVNRSYFGKNHHTSGTGNDS